jgi:hypothetical protein
LEVAIVSLKESLKFEPVEAEKVPAINRELEVVV